MNPLKHHDGGVGGFGADGGGAREREREKYGHRVVCLIWGCERRDVVPFASSR